MANCMDIGFEGILYITLMVSQTRNYRYCHVVYSVGCYDEYSCFFLFSFFLLFPWYYYYLQGKWSVGWCVRNNSITLYERCRRKTEFSIFHGFQRDVWIHNKVNIVAE